MNQIPKKEKTIFPAPFYYIIFYVSGVQGSNLSLLKTLFSDVDGGLKSSFEKGFAIRQHGWDLDLRQEYSINLYGIESENRLKRVQVQNNGTLIVEGALISDFLCWGAGEAYESDADFKTRRIHPLALAEFTYNAAIAYQKILSEIDKPIGKVECLVGFVGLEIDKHFLIEGTVGPGKVDIRRKYWKGDENEFPVDFDPAEFKYDENNLGKVAYKIIAGVYRMFGFSDDVVPYTVGEGEDKKISIEQIRSAV